MSPVQLTSKLTDAEVARLHAATQATLQRWIATAARASSPAACPAPARSPPFAPTLPCTAGTASRAPTAAIPVQRIRYADNETNYCPTCQTGGRLLADRSLSRLLKSDWPKTLEELDAFIGERRR